MAQEPSQEEVTNFFKAMAQGKLMREDVFGIGKPVGGRNNRIIHYRMNYPSAPVNPPTQNVTSEISETVNQARGELGLKGKAMKYKPQPTERSQRIHNSGEGDTAVTTKKKRKKVILRKVKKSSTKKKIIIKKKA